VFHAKFQLRSESGIGGRPDCQLGVMRGELFEAIDEIDEVALGAENGENDTAVYVLTGFATVDLASNGYLVRCSVDGAQNLSASDRTLVATQVGELVD
jgi:hypothetical protein